MADPFDHYLPADPAPPREPIGGSGKAGDNQTVQSSAPSDPVHERGELLLLGLQRQCEEAEASFLTDPDGRLLYSNVSMRALLPLLDHAEPGLLDRLIAEALALANDSLQPEVQVTGWRSLPRLRHRLSLPTGEELLLVDLSLFQDPDGNAKLLSGRLSRCPAETTGSQSENIRERFEDIVRLVTDWVWETDRDLRLTYVSQRVNETLGQHPRLLIGRSLLDLGQSPKLSELLTAQWRRPFRDVEVEITDRDARSRLFRLSAVPFYDPDHGSFAGYRGTAHDLTLERLREHAILQAKEAAESSNRAKSEFLAAISHELRTPLNAVIGFSEIMMTEAFGPIGTPVYAEYAQDIHQSAAHLLELINDILDISKIEAGKLSLDEEETDLEALIRSTARLVDARAAENGVALELAVAEGLPEVTLDARAVKQVLLNLLSNSVKFTERGGQISLKATIAASGDFLLQVRDSGIGMNQDDIEVALSPFGQVDSSLSRKFQGTGLGLPLSKGLVELHGGELEVESRKPGGTCVTVRLPAWRVVSEPESVHA
ncbi:PAS domain-containing sensor histidine kinase [Algihabitans albus]|uniref:PAS domain-containing sensor histidine kinase n=1 Tax=Algihabitans albus TaxID=2164067 RepID=UPI000E5CB647|nr:ATP-binding protein [Algihabitans albus]